MMVPLPNLACGPGNLGKDGIDSRNSRFRTIHVQLPEGAVISYQVDRNEKAAALKKRVQAHVNFPTDQAELVFGSQVLGGKNSTELSDLAENAAILLKTPELHRSQSTPCLRPNSTRSRRAGPPKDAVVPIGSKHCATAVKELLREVNRGIRSNVKPAAEAEGLGGAYFFKDIQSRFVGIIKPSDEEALAPNNPKGFVGRGIGEPGMKRNVRVGEAANREAAAFLLDHNGFSRVPRTALVKATHEIFNVNGSKDTQLPTAVADGAPKAKLASFQEFVSHDYDANEHSCSRFPVSEVHRIGILDVRLFNTDRHAGNILVRKCQRPELLRPSSVTAMNAGNGHVSALNFNRLESEGIELIPIDHGYCLPERVEGAYFEWLYWPQAAQPFSKEELEYIASLDARKDIGKLRLEIPNLREESLRLLEVTTNLLKRCAGAGMTLAEIGNLLTRPLVGIDEESSEVEALCASALEVALTESVDGECVDEIEEEDLSPLGCGGALSRRQSLDGYNDPLQFSLEEEEIFGSPPSSPRDKSAFISHSEDQLWLPPPIEGVTPRARLMSLSPPKEMDCEGEMSDCSSSPTEGSPQGIPVPGRSSGGLQMAYSMRIGGDTSHKFLRMASQRSPKMKKQLWQPRQRRPSHVRQGSTKDINIGLLNEAQWKFFVTLFSEYVDNALKDKQWKSNMKIETTEGSRLQTVPLGTSCPQF